MKIETKTVSILELETHIFQFEEILIIFRAPRSTQVKKYDYKRKASDTMKISDWIESRVKPLIGEIEISIIGGNFSYYPNFMSLKYLRDSYQ